MGGGGGGRVGGRRAEGMIEGRESGGDSCRTVGLRGGGGGTRCSGAE